MAMDMFIKIGDIKGESKDDGHKQEIDVLSWSWGVSNSGTMHAGGGGGSGKCNVNDVSFTKYIDASSCALFSAAFSGEHIAEALLTVRKAGGKAPLEYLKIKLTNILVTSVQTGGSGGEDRLTENVSLNFEKVNVDYISQDEKGAKKDPFKVGWDISANKAV
jgi:type VI secretion system secreted protein Hcp